MQDIAELADREDFKDEGSILAITDRISTMVTEVEGSYSAINPLAEQLNELYHLLLNSAITIEQEDLTAESK